METGNSNFKALFEHASIGIVIVDQEGIILNFNRYATALFGYEADEIIGQPVEKLIPLKWRASHPRQRESFHANPQPRTMGKGRDLAALRRDGSEFPIEISLSYYKEDGASRVIAFLIDITERKEAEHRIRQMKEESDRLIANLPGMVYRLDNTDDRNPILLSEGCLALTGYSPTDFKEQDIGFASLIHPEDLSLVSELQRRSLELMESYNVHYRIRTRTGQEKWVWDRGEGVATEDGHIILEGFMNDVTERIHSKQKLRELNSKLEKKVEARTQDLEDALMELQQMNVDLQKQFEKTREAEREAQGALKKERELNELKSRFVSMASHEFRTPLTTILSSASLLEKYTETEQQLKRSKNIGRIRKSVQNLTSILNDFLSLEKLQSGKLDYNPQAFSLEELLQEATEEMRRITKPGQEIQIEFECSSPTVHLDPHLLQNALLNLLSNAIKYSPENSQIMVRAREETGLLKISVKDAGIGIPEEEQKHLFTRFFRARNATNIQGTGLGLTIVKRYLELMQGRIEFESTEGEGTTFTLIFNQET